MYNGGFSHGCQNQVLQHVSYFGQDSTSVTVDPRHFHVVWLCRKSGQKGHKKQRSQVIHHHGITVALHGSGNNPDA